MGLFSTLFSRGADEPGPTASCAELMVAGKRELFGGKCELATRIFTRAISAAPQDPLPLAYRSWAGRLKNKKRAIVDSEAAINLEPYCAEAHMSLALARVTGTNPDFERAGVPFSKGTKEMPRDADGSVLSIGVFLAFADTVASMRVTRDALYYDFRPTPLRNAADWLLCGLTNAATAAFTKIYNNGGQRPGAMGMAATAWAAGDKQTAAKFANIAIDVGWPREPAVGQGVDNFGLLVALGNIREASEK